MQPTDLSWSLDQPLFYLSPQDPFTIRQAVEGVQIFGETGSGKTSGSGATLARAYLRAGFGGLILTVKPGEVDQWVRWVHDAGREDELLIVDASGAERFNFLDYEMRRPGGGFTSNIVELLSSVIRAVRPSRRGGSNEEYWQAALEELLRNAVDVVRLSGEPLSLSLLNDVIRGAATSQEMLEDRSWREHSECWRLLKACKARGLNESQAADFESCWFYWTHSFPVMLSHKQRGSILSMFSGMVDELLRAPFRELFSSSITFVPEQTHEGLLVLMDFPVHRYRRVGRVVQILMKLLFQEALLRREPRASLRPVFLYADEAQAFLTEQDAVFAATAREHRGAMVYLTQNLPGYQRALSDAESGTLHGMLSNLNTKVFHANNDRETVEWAAKLFGKRPVMQSSLSKSYTQQAGQRGEYETLSVSTDWQEHVRPESLQYGLRRGGMQHDCKVDAYILQSGRLWEATQTPALKVTFDQKPLPEGNAMR